MNHPKPKWSKIKPCLLLCLINLLSLNSIFGQAISKGATISSTTDTNKLGKIWAVIVGISKYQNVQGLNYADKDAIAFYDYLVNKKGIDKDHIQLLINEKAIASDIYGALDWLDLSVKENDRVIFYFSGHGDVETKTIHQNGFLLANDAPIAAYMTKGTISVNYLQDYLETYVAKRKVKDVLLIVDACRAGKLAGGNEGIQITMHALGQNWNNQIIKILSAQEGESSFEDKKWGGGRGVFSYYLVKGLEGLANRNADSVITTAELAAYLPFAVGDATNSIQNPTVTGNPKTNLFAFNKDLLALAKTMETQTSDGQLLAARGTKDELDPEIANWYNLYRTYLQKGRLIWGEKQTDTINCAKYYYLKLVKDVRAKSLLPSLKSSFVASLKHKTEKYLENINKKYFYDKSLNMTEAFKEIVYAKSLIDTSYILYNYLTARILFLEGNRTEDDLKRADFYKKVIQLEPDASYAYYSLGFQYDISKLNIPDSAIFYYKKAIELSPTWAPSLNNLGALLQEKQKYKEAIYYLEKGLKVDSEEYTLYFNLAQDYRSLGENLKADSILNKFILDRENWINKNRILRPKEISNEYWWIADAFKELKSYNKAIEILNKAIKLDSANRLLYQELEDIYYNMKDYDSFITVCLNAIKLKLDVSRSYYGLAFGYSLKNEPKKALKYLEISIQKGFNDYNQINEDTDLNNLRQLPEFQELMKKYFQDKVK